MTADDTIVTMKDCRGMSFREIGAELGLHHTTVLDRYHAAKGRMKDGAGDTHERLEDTISGDVRNLVSVSYSIRTVDELLAFAEVDRTEWQPDKITVNRWGNPDQPMYQVKATLKRSVHYDATRAMFDAFNERADSIKPLRKIRCARKTADEDALTFLPITDAHIAMLAWHRENRSADWDLDIAREQVVGLPLSAVQKSVSVTPAGTCLLCFMGDFTHYDSMESVTPANKHQLDADGRPQKMIRAANDIMIELVKQCAALFPNVIVWILEGNHDPMLSSAARDWMGRLFEANEQVDVVQDPAPYYAMEWGDALIGATHGHLKSGKPLGEVYSQRFRDMMSGTRKTFVHTGHRHSTKTDETNTTIIEQWPTIAAADAYASRHGYDSLRRVAAVTYHKKDMEAHRFWATVGPSRDGDE